MKYDAVSFSPYPAFCSETGKVEFESNKHCLSLDKGITLHLKKNYLDFLFGDSLPEDRQILKWYFYTTHLNCLYLLLDSFVMEKLKIAHFTIEEVTTQNIAVVSKPGSISRLKPFAETFRPDALPRPLKIRKDILELINESFSKTMTHFEKVYVLSEAAKSIASFKSADFTTSFVLSWFLIERFLQSRWESYLEVKNKDLDHGQKRINADRKKTLNDSRSFPVSVKLQILELAGELPFEQFLDLDSLRGKRNDIVHPPKGIKKDLTAKVTSGNCVKAFELLKQFIASDFELCVNFSTSYSMMGVYER